MVVRSKGLRSKSRHVLQKRSRDQGVSSITRALQEFTIGDRVSIDIDPSIHKGQPHHRFQGYTGYIQGQQGDAYLVGITVGKKAKTLLVRPEHLGRVS